MALGLSLVTSGQANAVQSVTIDATQIDAKIAPGLTFAQTPDWTDVNMIQIGIDTTNDTYKDLQITNFSAKLTIAGKTTSYPLLNQDLYRDYSGEGHTYFFFLTNDGNQGLKTVADLSLVTKVVLKGVVRARSTANDALKTKLADLGLTVNEIYISGNGYTGTDFAIGGKNDTKKEINVTASAIEFDGVALTPNSANLNVIAGDYFYWEFAKTNRNLSWNRLGKNLSAILSVPKASTLDVSKVTLPTGLITAPTKPATEWWYSAENNYSGPKYVNRNATCMNVKNSTSKDISVQAQLIWTVDGVATPNTTSEVTNVQAGKTQCLRGYADDVYGLIGDARFGKVVKVSGTVKPVTQAKVDTSGLTLPRGYSVDSAQTTLSYSSETNKTTIVLAIKAPDGYDGALYFYRGKINSTKTLSSQVSFSRESGGPGVPVGNFKLLNLGPLSGDSRVGKTLVLSGKVAEADPTTTDSWTQFSSGVLEYSVYCLFDQPALWIYNSNTNKTTVTGFCFNTSLVDHTVSLGDLKVKVTNSKNVTTNYSAISANTSSIFLKSRAGYTSFSAVEIDGDARSNGGSILFVGTLKLVK